MVIWGLSSARPSSAELTSWKEIAAFLGVSVRTAQLWEAQRGLPVRRLPGGRSRVSVSLAALEAWRETQRAGPPPAPARHPALTVFRAALVGAALVASAAALWLALRPPPQPAALDLDGDALVVLDRHGHELWRKRFVAPLLPPIDGGGSRGWVGDLEGDGKLEVLFAPAVSPSAAAPLTCLGEGGAEKWRFLPGREVATSLGRYSREFRVETFVVFPIGGRSVIAVASSEKSGHPAQVALLSARGELQAEYWHSGNLISLAAGDLDRDGAPELYAGGVSSSFGAATLIALDPRAMAGASREPEGSGHQITGFPPPRERARLILPRSCINRLVGTHSTVTEISLEGGRITAGVREAARNPARPRMFYHFTPAMQFQSAVPSDGFRELHRRLESIGSLDHPLSADEEPFRAVRRVP